VPSSCTDPGCDCAVQAGMPGDAREDSKLEIKPEPEQAVFGKLQHGACQTVTQLSQTAPGIIETLIRQPARTLGKVISGWTPAAASSRVDAIFIAVEGRRIHQVVTTS
jgi:hypothetical protein